jgi:hypothetical protein
MLIVVVYLYAASVTLWAMDFAIASSGIHSLLMVPDTPIPDRGDLANANRAKFLNPAEAFVMINVRIQIQSYVFNIEGTARWLLQMAFSFGALGSSVNEEVSHSSYLALCCLCRSVSFWNPLFGGYRLTPFAVFSVVDISNSYTEAICPAAATIAWAFSLATNVGCTILVGFKAWYIRMPQPEHTR